MRAVAALGPPGPRVLRDHGIEVAIPRSGTCTVGPGSITPNAMTGREMMEHTGLTSGLEAVGEVFRSTANIVCGQAEIASTPSRPSSSQYSAGS